MSGPSPPNTKDTSRPPTRPDRSPAEDTKVNHADHHRRSRRGRRPGTGSTGRAATGVKPEPGTFNASGPSHPAMRSEEHTSELQSLMRISYAVFCWKNKTTHKTERKQK